MKKPTKLSLDFRCLGLLLSAPYSKPLDTTDLGRVEKAAVSILKIMGLMEADPLSNRVRTTARGEEQLELRMKGRT